MPECNGRPSDAHWPDAADPQWLDAADTKWLKAAPTRPMASGGRRPVEATVLRDCAAKAALVRVMARVNSLLAASVVAALYAAVQAWVADPSGPSPDEFMRDALAHMANGMG